MAKKFRRILSLIFAAIFCFSSMGMASVALATEENGSNVAYIYYGEVFDSKTNFAGVVKEGIPYHYNSKKYEDIREYDDSVVEASLNNGKIEFSLVAGAAEAETASYNITADRQSNDKPTDFRVDVYKYTLTITDENLNLSITPDNFSRSSQGSKGTVGNVIITVTADEGYSVPASISDISTTGNRKRFEYSVTDGVGTISMDYVNGDVTFIASAIKNPEPKTEEESQSTDDQENQEEIEVQPDGYIVFSIDKGEDVKDRYAKVGFNQYTKIKFKTKTENRFVIPVVTNDVLNAMRTAGEYTIKTESKFDITILDESNQTVENNNMIETILESFNYDGNTFKTLAENAAVIDTKNVKAYVNELGLSLEDFGKTWDIDWYVMKNQKDAVHVDGVIRMLENAEEEEEEEEEEVDNGANKGMTFSVAKIDITDTYDGSFASKFDGKDVKNYFQIGAGLYPQNPANRYMLFPNYKNLCDLMKASLNGFVYPIDENTNNVNETKVEIDSVDNRTKRNLVEDVLGQLEDGNMSFLSLAEIAVKEYVDQNGDFAAFLAKLSEDKDETFDASNYGTDWYVDWYVMKTQNDAVHVDGFVVPVTKTPGTPTDIIPDIPVIDDDDPKTQPTDEQPATEEPAAEEPASEEPATEEPATEEPATEEPATEEPATEEPATEEPAAEEPASEEPATEEPAAEEPAAEEPASEEPVNNNTQPSTPNYVPAFYPASNVNSATQETELDEELIPLADMPEIEEELDEDLIPLADAPEVEEELEDDIVPLGDAPQTGDTAMISLFAMLMLISAIALVALLCIARRESKKENNR